MLLLLLLFLNKAALMREICIFNTSKEQVREAHLLVLHLASPRPGSHHVHQLDDEIVLFSV